jgi:pantoate--beta-alanine ligase
MIVFKQVAALQKHLHKYYIKNTSVGFVPTMGALHEGHISLLNKSKEIADKTVCSIFVNPTQFNNPEDFKNYPVNIEKDILLLEKSACDVLFLPGVNEIYPDESINNETFDLGSLENILEGKFRPHHFQGVCMVVKRLLEIVSPSYLFAGQKDYQQCMVFKRLLHLIKSKTQLIICPTTRQKDGLALSSRNLRLTDQQRSLATEMYKTLSMIKQKIKPGSMQQLKRIGVEHLNEKGFKTDYVEIAKAENLEIVNTWNGNDALVILAAAHLGNIRLIDNVTYNVRFNKAVYYVIIPALCCCKLLV